MAWCLVVDHGDSAPPSPQTGKIPGPVGPVSQCVDKLRKWFHGGDANPRGCSEVSFHDADGLPEPSLCISPSLLILPSPLSSIPPTFNNMPNILYSIYLPFAREGRGAFSLQAIPPWCIWWRATILNHFWRSCNTQENRWFRREMWWWCHRGCENISEEGGGVANAPQSRPYPTIVIELSNRQTTWEEPRPSVPHLIGL